MEGAGKISVAALPADFDQWDALLSVIRASFAYMDGVIDPPSSVHRLTPETLRAKVAIEICFLAIAGEAPGYGNLPLSASPSTSSGSAPLPHVVGERMGASLAAVYPLPSRSGGEVPSVARRRGGKNAIGDSPAIAGDDIVGCAFLAEQPDHFYLGKLAVLPAYQGRGVGRQLLEAAEDHARRAGKPIIELQTRIELTGNHATFATLGFVETGSTAHEGYDRPTSVAMRKALQ